MKKLLLLPVLLLMFSCTPDEENKCTTVQGKQIKYLSCGGGLKCAVFYFWMTGDSGQIEVSEQDYNKFNVNDVYCK